MKHRRNRLMATGALGAVAIAGYFLYSVIAAQGQGALAQAPMNDQIQVEPAFIMAVDDSNSMTFERMFPGGDGRMQWNSNNSSFFNADGSFYSVGTGCANNSTDCYLYLYPHSGYNSSYSPGDAIPPLDIYGFARSPAYNASYFNPAITYEPWMNADGTLWPQANPSATRADPRDPDTYGDSFETAYDVVYNLTANRAVTSEYFSFNWGMSIPNLAGTSTSYRRRNSNNNGWSDNNWQTGAVSFNGSRNVAFNYFPATFYLPADADAPPGYRTGNQFRPVINNACGPGCNLRRYEIKPANYLTTQDYNAAIQNFANWFQYHRSRLLAMVGAMTHAMQDVNNMRVGYFTINDRVSVTMRDVATDRSALYDSFFRLQAGGLVGKGGGTPNRDAVSHLGEQFRRTGDNAPIKYACQRNGGMLFTDGFTNSGNGPTGIGNVDGDLGAPFSDSFDDTIADIASRYYLSADEGGLAPLRTGGGFPAGQVPVPDACKLADPDLRLDCQRNLHMNFYGVTLGARGSIFDVNAAATADPYANPPAWDAAGNPRSSDGAPTIDEIWHATINTRGEFINAKTPADITEAMRRVLSSVAAGASPSGSVGLTGERVGASTLYVVPRYEVRSDGTDWFSTLAAFKVEKDDATGEMTETQVWEAAARLPAAGARDVWFGRNGGVERFNDANANITWNLLCSNTALRICTPSEAGALGGTLAEAVNYLLGDTTREKRLGGVFRDRSTRLGDIVNSPPVVSSPTDDYGYRILPEPYGSAYADYLEAKEESRNTMVYVGANDGMLHAFDSGMRADGSMPGAASTLGRERFAYIPEVAVGHMGNLLFPRLEEGVNQKFQHRYFVDGPITVSDAYYGSAWHTVLVGTAGAGGRGVFSLEVGSMSAHTSTPSFAASKRLWEINDRSANASIKANIGHVLGRPLIVPVKKRNGSVAWKAIFGNGFGSADGKAVLFVVDVNDPANVHMIEAVEDEATNPPAHMTNGLGNVIAVDRWGGGDALNVRRRDGFVDTVYGADQRGALWKFDLRDISMSGVNSTVVETPLFVTQTYQDGGQTFRQPIIGGLTAVAAPGGRLMVIFGTGSFSFVGDAADTSVQSLYGILDREDGATVTLASLHQRTLAAAAPGATARSVSTTPPALGNRGWYLNLPAGERFVGYPSILSGAVMMATYTPNMVAGGGCSTAGFNWLFGLDARTGAPAMSQIRFGSTTGPTQAEGVGAVALDTGGTAPIKNVEVMVTTLLENPTPPPPGEDAECDEDDPDCVEELPPPPAPPTEKCWARALVSGAPPMFRPYMCGRLSWRQIQ